MKELRYKCTGPRFAIYTAALFVFALGLIFYFSDRSGAEPPPPAMVEICHIPPDDPSNFQTIKVAENALAGHLGHGDMPGACGDACETLCDDDDACTSDFCDENEECAHAPMDCDDSDECTDDSCDSATGCVNTNNNASCDDGMACTDQDACVEGDCVGVAIEDCCSSDIDCDDSDPCNGIETCDTETSECVNGTPIDCNDGDACTADSCDPLDGSCANVPVTCDDGDVCNGTETCDPVDGCQAGEPLSCDDGDVCNGTETCDAANGCQLGTPLNCDDQNACTTDSCDAANGCSNIAQEGLSCNDGDACTESDACDANGNCVGTDITGDQCTPDSHQCRFGEIVSCDARGPVCSCPSGCEFQFCDFDDICDFGSETAGCCYADCHCGDEICDEDIGEANPISDDFCPDDCSK